MENFKMKAIKIANDLVGFKIEVCGSNGYLRLFDENKNEFFDFNQNAIRNDTDIALYLGYKKYQENFEFANSVKRMFLKPNL